METNRSVVPATEEILNRYFPVLDHGFIALVDYMGSDAEIARSARTSYGHGTKGATEDEGLLRYMYRHGHTSPFEMCELKFHCSMPIFVARQWIRHRTANVNEVSGRYSVLPTQFYLPDEEQIRKQSTTNKQGRSTEVIHAPFAEQWNTHRERTKNLYQNLLAADMARELARIDLPLSTYTQWYWKIDLHNLFHFLTLRVDSHAQWEIQQYAKIMAAMVFRAAPFSARAWFDYDVMGVKFSRQEMAVLRDLLMLDPNKDILENTDSCEFKSYLIDSGKMTKRETDEFFSQFDPDLEKDKAPIFDLDLSQAKDGSYFEERAKRFL